MALDYAWEKFYVAVDTLASGTGSIQERLADAYMSALIRLYPADLPKNLREDFEKLRVTMRRIEPTSDEGRITAAARAMSTDEAQQWAEKIVSMFNHIAREFYSQTK